MPHRTSAVQAAPMIRSRVSRLPPSLRRSSPSTLPAFKGAKLMYVNEEKMFVTYVLFGAIWHCRCIGRIAWNTLMVRDKRHVTDLDEIFAECMEHQRLAMADGR